MLYDVWGVAGGSVFAVGANGLILERTEAGWSEVEDVPTNEDLVDVWGTLRTDVVAVGYGGTILRFDGFRWTEDESPTNEDLMGVWGSSSSDVWAVGTLVVLHYDGNSWEIDDQGTGLTNQYHEDVWGLSSQEVYIVGNEGKVLEYDGSNWRLMTTTTSHLFGIWGRSSSDLYAVGVKLFEDRNETIFHHDGTTWCVCDNPDSVSLFGVWGTGDAVVAVGAGTVLSQAQDGSCDDCQWIRMNGARNIGHWGVWGRNSSDMFAVGQNGTVLRFSP